MVKQYEVDFGGKNLIIETGKMAKQAGGSCTVTYGDTIVLVTACRSSTQPEGIDFLPLTVNYMEMSYSAGKIPGGFFKREGRQSEKEVLCSRLIDRPLRPLFEDGYGAETQVIATVLSADHQCDPEVLAMIGASAALCLSDIPFKGPIAGIRVAMLDGKLVCNPTIEEQKESTLDLLVAGGEKAIMMVEGGAEFASEASMIEALKFAEDNMAPVIELQKKMRDELGKTNIAVEAPVADIALEARVKETLGSKLEDALKISEKMERYATLDTVKSELKAALAEEFEGREGEISACFAGLKYSIMRNDILKTKKRIGGRGLTEVRDITCEIGILPRAHGSALFTRGETQALVVATLGTSDDEQKIDALSGWYQKKFMLHYNFPPYCVGEVRFLRGASRREVGHGSLAERAVAKIIPKEDYEYTVRLVSDVLESNGSSSMASVCGGSLALMDAGVPVKDHVAGIAMGLIKEGDDYVILSDILGDEDHLGDMDFKVAGTKEGITSIQMDIKIAGVSSTLLEEALAQAFAGRLHIIGCMEKAIAKPRDEMSEYAPRIVTLQVSTDKIKDVIGPGGKNIKNIVATTGVKIDIDDTGKVNIASTDEEASAKAVAMVEGLTAEAEVGRIYQGTVRKITDFGAFIEILPGTDGLCHISQIAEERVQNVTDFMKEGDIVPVKVIEVDRTGKIRLSRKEALEDTKED